MQGYLSILFLSVVCISSFNFVRIQQIYLDIYRGEVRIEKSYYHLVRKEITEGTVHLIANKNYHGYFQSIIFNNLQKDMQLLENKWNSSGSYNDFEGNLFDLENRIAPLRLYLLPRNKTHEQILNAYKALTAEDSFTYKVGYVAGDYDPGKGPFNFSATGGFALDKNNHSLGADLGEAKRVVALRLNSQDEKYRIKPENLSLWYSNDNKIFYKYWGGLKIYLEIKSIFIDQIVLNHRYLKINCNLNDNNYTFAENFNTMLKIYGSLYFPKRSGP